MGEVRHVDAVMPGVPGPQVIGSGQDQGTGLVDLWVRSERAVRLATISARIASTSPSQPFGAPRPCRTARPGRRRPHHNGVGLALPAPVLPVRPVHLHDSDTGRGDVAGQARAVTAGALDPDQADGPRTRPADGRTRPG